MMWVVWIALWVITSLWAFKKLEHESESDLSEFNMALCAVAVGFVWPITWSLGVVIWIVGLVWKDLK